ncbi:hypothetical protein WR25_19045 isoform A [Diploscapter pachys]|uniref:Rab11-FIP3/4 domain-containing protein n=1 Tax=Diploscapter pachys TaxID=2018661 RepID=A0A2A2JJS3_9BILA|nr:hypothetical protein WR25_19045 isoform A [Diploscapter pachys]
MRLQGSSASSASVASRLYGTRSRRDSLGSDPELISFSDSDNVQDFNSQMTSFTKRLNEFEERNMALQEERSRLKTENAVLMERIHVLEEQLQTSEQRYKEQMQEDKSRSKDLLARVEREKQLEAESHALKYQMLEKDLQSAKKEAEKTHQEAEKAKSELDKVKGDLAQSQFLVESLDEELMKLNNQFKRFKEEAKQDIDSSSEMVEVLTAETEELRKRINPRQGSVAEQMMGLEEELERAKLQIRQLNSEKEELQAQLLASDIGMGRNLIANAPSLADELAGGDSQQVLIRKY